VGEDIADLQRRVEDSELSASQLPHREKYLLLVSGFLRGLLELHLELVDEIERELQGDGIATAPPPAGGGVASSRTR